MRTRLLWLSLPLLMLIPISFHKNVRSVRPLVETPPAPVVSKRFDPRQSAGMFVGIRRYPKKARLTEVQFAADDAVDLAYAFSLAKGALLPVSRVTIALSGPPSKRLSKERLRQLKAAGAQVVENVEREDLLRLLREQADLAGVDGLLLVSFAMHGFTADGVPYLLAPDSTFLDVRSSISVPEIADIAGSGPAKRSLILLDACRERVRSDTRTIDVDPRAAAAFLDAMTKIEGQVIFSAAAGNGYAFDDLNRGNGVFSAAILDSLKCEGTRRTFITMHTLHTFVEKQVLAYRRQHEPNLRKATQISVEGRTDTMPIAQCRETPPLLAMVENVTVRGATVTAFDARGRTLWTKTLSGMIRGAKVVQLFEEKTHQIVVLSEERNGTAALLSIYDNAGGTLTSFEHDGPLHEMRLERPTPKHNPRILLAGFCRNAPAALALPDSIPAIMLLTPKLHGGVERNWYYVLPTARRITNLFVGAMKKQRAITITTDTGKKLSIDFEGDFQGGNRSEFVRIDP